MKKFEWLPPIRRWPGKGGKA
eukprot:SAG11_NODE_37758_length_255_cov_0.980769_1_plen_20_part_01